ncbi:MAG: ComEC/Rec2 family competence protein, partial [Planctomycetota bacterium]|nr:ComEC/Rec2 family competence protein [Planctomycetota bacterium]
MAAGIVAGRYAQLSIGIWATLGISAFLAAVITLRREHLRGLTNTAIAGAIFFTSATWAALSYYRIPENHIVTFSSYGLVLATVRGRIISTPRIQKSQTPYWQPAKTSFLLDAEAIRCADGAWLETTGPVRVTVGEPVGDLSGGHQACLPGRQVELVGSLQRPGPPGNPGQYDWRAADRYQGIFVKFFVPGADGVRTLKDARGNWLANLWLRARLTARRHLKTCGGEDETVLLEALILGERDPALRELNRIMVEAGIAHFMSISGLHLGIFLGFIYWLCRLLMFLPRRSAWIVLIILAGYVLLAEPRAPLLRSAIMATAICIAVISNRIVSARNALAAAAVILLIIDPLQIFRAGFQLSFGIVCGIIILHRPIKRLLFGRWLRRRGLMVFRGEHRIRRWMYYRGADWLITLTTISVSAYIAAAPLVAYHFGRFCPYAPALSILLLPMLVAVLIPAYISMTLAFLTPNLAAAIGAGAADAAGMMRHLVMLTKYL